MLASGSSTQLDLNGHVRLRLPLSQEIAAMGRKDALPQVLHSQDLSITINHQQYHSDPMYPIMTDNIYTNTPQTSSETSRLRPIRWPGRTYIIFTSLDQLVVTNQLLSPAAKAFATKPTAPVFAIKSTLEVLC